jgi:hypothetical protein
VQNYQITEEERVWAQRVLDEGEDTNVHLLSYCRFLTNPAPGTWPVRNAGGGIVGYGTQAVADEIARLGAKEAEHLAAADASTEPELDGAHRAVAQNYRLARMVRETDAAYAAQSFELGAVGWENIMDRLPELARVYVGKSSGMWPHQRAERDTVEVDAAADRLMEMGRKALADRQHRHAVAAFAKDATDADLSTEIKKVKDSDTAAFLILIRERDARDKRVRAARTRSLEATASEAPWTEDEERLLSNTAAQTAKMTLTRLRQHRDAFAPTEGSTRGNQLKYEAVVRELDRRGKS